LLGRMLGFDFVGDGILGGRWAVGPGVGGGPDPCQHVDQLLDDTWVSE
jgi:hypothetical protein